MDTYLLQVLALSSQTGLSRGRTVQAQDMVLFQLHPSPRAGAEGGKQCHPPPQLRTPQHTRTTLQGCRACSLGVSLLKTHLPVRCLHPEMSAGFLCFQIVQGSAWSISGWPDHPLQAKEKARSQGQPPCSHSAMFSTSNSRLGKETGHAEATFSLSLGRCQGDWNPSGEGGLQLSHHPVRKTGLLPLQN